jgi:hypothetical protein
MPGACAGVASAKWLENPEHWPKAASEFLSEDDTAEHIETLRAKPLPSADREGFATSLRPRATKVAPRGQFILGNWASGGG